MLVGVALQWTQVAAHHVSVTIDVSQIKIQMAKFFLLLFLLFLGGLGLRFVADDLGVVAYLFYSSLEFLDVGL